MNTELTNEITLIEADSTRFYAPDKGDFRGRAATENVRQQGIATKLVYGDWQPPIAISTAVTR